MPDVSSIKPDKFAALWVSHSSMNDFLGCPRAYYISNVYKNPKTGRKISLMKPPLALGQAVHAVFDALSDIPTEERKNTDFLEIFEKKWDMIAGEKGGFSTISQEAEYKERGRDMVKRVQENPGPIFQKTLHLKEMIPFYWLSEKDNIILCGKIDWIEYLEETNSIHIIDFKTGKRIEKEESLQLPIYYLLGQHSQKRNIDKLSYWYLEHDDNPKQMPIPDTEVAENEILKVATRMKLAKQLDHFKCSKDPVNGCMHCAPFEMVLKGHAKFVGVGEFNKEVYILPDEATSL